jgi:hypothetical protein
LIDNAKMREMLDEILAGAAELRDAGKLDVVTQEQWIAGQSANAVGRS